MCTEGPDNEQYIVQGYTEDQAGQDIQAEDVIHAKNLVWYTWDERRAWQEKTTTGISAYGNCTDCYWGGPVGMLCMHCEGKGRQKPKYVCTREGSFAKFLGIKFQQASKNDY